MAWKGGTNIYSLDRKDQLDFFLQSGFLRLWKALSKGFGCLGCFHGVWFERVWMVIHIFVVLMQTTGICHLSIFMHISWEECVYVWIRSIVSSL